MFSANSFYAQQYSDQSLEIVSELKKPNLKIVDVDSRFWLSMLGIALPNFETGGMKKGDSYISVGRNKPIAEITLKETGQLAKLFLNPDPKNQGMQIIDARWKT